MLIIQFSVTDVPRRMQMSQPGGAISPLSRNRTRLPSAAVQSGITGLSPTNLIIVICS